VVQSLNIDFQKEDYPAAIFRILKFMNTLLIEFDTIHSFANSKTELKLTKEEMFEPLRKNSIEMIGRYFHENAIPQQDLLVLVDEEESSDAMMLIGYRYWLGVTPWVKDIEQAKDWLLKASSLGNNYADLFLGFLYEIEEGNPTLAFSYYQRATKNGNGFAKLHQDYFEDHKIKQANWKRMSREIEIRRKSCLENCMTEYKITEVDCTENFCKNHLLNIDSWVQRSRYILNR
jgi:TPR repeat protein